MKITIDGRPLDTDQLTTDCDGTVFIDLKHVKSNLGAIASTIENESQVMICLNDHCVTWEAPDLLDLNGRTFVRLDSLTAVLGFHHQVRGDTLLVNTARPKSTTGLGVGDTPPKIELPNIDTGLAVGTPDFQGQRTIFFMWASW